jgi:hypothetical protein
MCGSAGRIPDAFLGRKVKCPKCQTPFIVQTSLEPAPEPPPPPRAARPSRRPAPPPQPAEDELEEVEPEADDAVIEADVVEDEEASVPSEGERIDYLRAYRYIFENPRWVTNVLLFAVCCLIPVVGGIAALGYGYDVLASLIRRRRRTYPDFEFGRFGDYLGRGIWPFLMQLLLEVPILIVLQVLVFILVFTMPRVFFSLGPVPNIVYALVLAALGFLLMPLCLRAGVSRSLDLGGSFGFARDFFGRVGLQALLVYLFLMVTGSAVLFLGIILCCVGMLPAFAILTLAQMQLASQLYQVYLARGGEPIPVRQ